MSALMQSAHWQYVWPSYALAMLVFAGLAAWAFLALRAAAKRAQESDKP